MTTAADYTQRLLHEGTFEAALAELKRARDPGLYAELLSGTTWSPGRGEGDHIYGSLQPGRLFARRGMHRSALDSLLLLLLTEADGPVAAALREEVLSLRLVHGARGGTTDLTPLSALPNLRSLGLDGVNLTGPLPRLDLDRLELVHTPGVPKQWLDAVAPIDFWTDGEDVPGSVVRLRLDGTGAGGHGGHGGPCLAGLPALEELKATWCPGLILRECPRLHSVLCAGSFDLETLASWSALPDLQSLHIENGFSPQVPSAVRLPTLPRLRTLLIDGAVRLSSLPATVTHLRVSMPDLVVLQGLDRPVELHVPSPAAVVFAGGSPRPEFNTSDIPKSVDFPTLRDGTALEVLDVSGRAVTDRSLADIRSFPELRRLHLARTPVADLSGLKGHPRLEVVDISDCTALRNIDALATLPALRVVLMAGACAMTPADLPPGIEWMANRQMGPDVDALLTREPPRTTARRLPPGLPRSAARLYAEVFPLMLRRDYDAIDVAIDEFVAAGIPEVWDWWLDGVQMDRLCPRRMSPTLTDWPYTRHAALRLIGAAPDTCAVALRFRGETSLRAEARNAPGGRFDLSLLAGLPHLESALIGCLEMKLPGSARPEWLPRLTSLHIVLSNPAERLDGPRELEKQLRRVLPHVPNVVVRG